LINSLVLIIYGESQAVAALRIAVEPGRLMGIMKKECGRACGWFSPARSCAQFLILFVKTLIERPTELAISTISRRFQPRFIGLMLKHA
jgi:hypothetical protein